MSSVVEAEVLLGVSLPNVALKVMHRALSADQESIARLLREADLVRSLRHPNVCEVFDMGRTAAGQPFLVMELLRGRSLAERLDDGALSPLEALDAVLPVLSALEAAHARGVVHRDIKPDNVFLVDDAGGEHFTGKLLDFGIARAYGREQADQRLTDVGVVMGTPYYMAPEQARGRRRLDPRVDIFSVGVILYEALTGRRPFAANNYNALLVAILTEEPTPVRELAPHVTEGLARIVRKAMAKLPEQRFQSAREFFEALRTVQAELCPSELDELTVAIDGHVLAEDLDAERATLVPLAARQGGGGRQTEPDAGRTDPLVDPLGAAGALYDDETVSIG